MVGEWDEGHSNVLRYCSPDCAVLIDVSDSLSSSFLEFELYIRFQSLLSFHDDFTHLFSHRAHGHCFYEFGFLDQFVVRSHY